MRRWSPTPHAIVTDTFRKTGRYRQQAQSWLKQVKTHIEVNEVSSL
jgi:hypothetical protein